MIGSKCATDVVPARLEVYYMYVYTFTGNLMNRVQIYILITFVTPVNLHPMWKRKWQELRFESTFYSQIWMGNLKKEFYKDKIRLGMEKKPMFSLTGESNTKLLHSLQIFSFQLSLHQVFYWHGWIQRRKRSIIFWSPLNRNVHVMIKSVLQAAVQNIFINHLSKVTLSPATTICEMSFW